MIHHSRTRVAPSTSKYTNDSENACYSFYIALYLLSPTVCVCDIIATDIEQIWFDFGRLDILDARMSSVHVAFLSSETLSMTSAHALLLDTSSQAIVGLQNQEGFIFCGLCDYGLHPLTIRPLTLTDRTRQWTSQQQQKKRSGIHDDHYGLLNSRMSVGL